MDTMLVSLMRILTVSYTHLDVYKRQEQHSILLSSHITSDLERVADYIVFIHEGRIV